MQTQTPEELIKKCKAHLNDPSTPQQWYKTDIRMLITALERALSLGVVVGQSEQFYCYEQIEYKNAKCENQCKDCINFAVNGEQ